MLTAYIVIAVIVAIVAGVELYRQPRRPQNRGDLAGGRPGLAVVFGCLMGAMWPLPLIALALVAFGNWVGKEG